MKIVTPLTNKDAYLPLAQAGADEFFCGYIPIKWLRKYTNIMPLNRRESILQGHNINDVVSMQIIGKYIQTHHIPVKITLNSHYYTPDQYPLLEEIICELMEMGFRTFILADIALLIYLRERGIDCNIHISGEIEVCNRETIHLLSKLKIERVVFPRRITLDGIKTIIAHTREYDLEYEAFGLNAMCLYSGAFCNGIHHECLQNPCEIPGKAVRFNEDSNHLSHSYRALLSTNKMQRNINVKNIDISNIEYSRNYSIGASGCGLCRIKALAQIGVTHLKVVGRGVHLDSIKRDIQNTKQIIGRIDDFSQISEFEQMVKHEYLNGTCTYLCYYPSGLSQP